MIYLNNYTVNKFGNFNRAYLKGRLIYQTMTSESISKKYWKITHNDWQDGSEGDKLDEHTVYVTNKNNGKIRIQFGGYSDFTIQIRTNHYNTSNYTLIGELNYDWVNSSTIPTYNSEHIVDDTRDTINKWAAYTFTNLDPNKTYFVDVISITNVDAYWNFLAIPDVVDVPDEPTASTYVLIETNDQWELSTVPCDEGYTTYQSFAHKGSDNTIDRLRIKLFGYDTFAFKYRSYAESNYDYLCIGELDKDFSNATSSIDYSTTGVKYHTRGVQSSTVWNDATYDNINPTVEHFIDVIYRKDGSTSRDDDRGYIGVVLGEIIEEWRASTTEYITVKNADGTYTFYVKEYKYVSSDDGKTWIPTATSRQGETELEQSTSTVDGYLCNNGNKYAKNEIYINLGGNLVGTKIYSMGDLIEEGAEDCKIQQIEWVANTTGSSRSDVQNLTFDTGVNITNRTKFQIKYKWFYSSGGMLVGDTNAGDDNNDYRFFNYGTSTNFGPNTLYFDINSKRTSSSSNLYAPIDKTFEIECGNHYIKNLVDGQIKTGKINTDVFTREGNIALWGGNANSTDTTLSNTDGARIYYLKVYDGEELVRDLVPALNSDNQAGLYDRLDGTFYLPQGSGTLYHSEM